jgi:cellulose synthase operon protein YhjQ
MEKVRGMEDERLAAPLAFRPRNLLDAEAALGLPEHGSMGRALERVARVDRMAGQDAGLFPSGSLGALQPLAGFTPEADPLASEQRSAPAWLYEPPSPPQRARVSLPEQTIPHGDTLLDSRERVAARWFALKGVFDHAGRELPAMQPALPGARTPLLLVFSLAGGVGKTSLVATLGRALSSQGERVLLTDTTSHGLLPFYFGARELRPGAMRIFSPPAGSTNAPIHLVSYEMAGNAGDERRQAALTDEIFRNAQGCNRVVLDLAAGAEWLMRRMAALQPTVLVPVAPDMNSVISLQSVERLFEGMGDADGRPLLPFYVLNQFDATLPLHLDVREVLRRQLGDRLLRFVVRRSPVVSEALAEGMTVVDYAPEASVTKDYLDVAEWLREFSPPAAAGLRSPRWSER